MIGSYFYLRVPIIIVTRVRRIGCVLCGWHRPLISGSRTRQRDEDGFPIWDIDPETFPVLRFQDFDGNSSISPMVTEATLAEMSDSTDPLVQEQFERIRRQVLRLAEIIVE